MFLTTRPNLFYKQIGFVATYTSFVAENIKAVIQQNTADHFELNSGLIILAQLVIYIPLSYVRRIARLSWCSLVADAFILIGLAYVYYDVFATMTVNGVAPIVQFNTENFAVFIGTAVFAFEGIGLVIPITEAMKEPQKFPKVLTLTMIGIALVFASVGAFAYMAYGSNVQTVVLLNLPAGVIMTPIVQILYSLAIVLSAPLQFFPAIRQDLFCACST